MFFYNLFSSFISLPNLFSEMNLVGDIYTWTYFPYDETGAAKGNVAAAFDVHTNAPPA